MRSPLSTCLRSAALSALLAALLAAAPAAQSLLSGNVFDGAGGPLVSGTTYHVTSSITVPAGETLTVPPNVNIKFNAATVLNVSGTLDIDGSVDFPVRITSVRDDAAGGDTNADGTATTPLAGDWGGIVVKTDGAVDLDHIDVAYAGWGGWSAIFVNGSGTSLDLNECVLRDSTFDALDLNNSSIASIVVTGCSFNSSTGFAVAGAKLRDLPGWSGNTASGNASGDYIQFIDNTVSAATDQVVTLDQLLNGVLVPWGNMSIPSGSSLSLPAGLVLKARPNLTLNVSGTLTGNGTAGSPIVVTSDKDDSAAGDTNEDGGATTPAAGNWAGFLVNGTGTLDLNWTEVRYAGFGGWSPVFANGSGASILLSDCTLRDAAFDALALNNQNLGTLSVADCSFEDSGGFAVAGAKLRDLPSFSNNTASGNVSGDYIQIIDGNVTAVLQTVTDDQLINGVIGVHASVSIPSGSTLQILAGLVAKLSPNINITVQNGGTLDIDGSGQFPVVITSFKDDTVLGDTNKDGGATTPSAGDWGGIVVNTNATADLDHLILRYGGFGGFAPVYVNTTTAEVELDAVRAEYAAFDGFFLQDAEWVRDCVAYACVRDGFALFDGDYPVERCTSVANGDDGFSDAAAHTGNIHGVISWANGGDNFEGVASGDLRWSNGDGTLAGSDGNVFADPLFVDQAGGDLRLMEASVCIDNGDPGDLPLSFDLAGFPRLLDGNLNNTQRLDMGAYEYDNVELEITGNFTSGGDMLLDVTGKAGLNSWLFIGLVPTEVPLKSFGLLTVDLGAPSLLLAWPTVPSSVPLLIPAIPTPLTAHFQVLGLDGTLSTDAGNMSNPVTIVIE